MLNADFPRKKILLAIPHYFKAEERPTHAYNDGAKAENRRSTVFECISRWSSLFSSEQAELIIKDKNFEIHESGYEIDIRILVYEDKHLLNDSFYGISGLKVVKCAVDDPRMLGFCAHKLFEKRLSDYDIFIYAEDDIFVEDISLIDKITFFSEKHGENHLLFPNRYEINKNGPRYVTYIDGAVSNATQEKFRSFCDAPDTIKEKVFSREVVFSRAKNPHSGFFLLTKNQLKRWIGSNGFMDLDCSFVSPLESASSLSLAKLFSIYKSCDSSLSYCSVRHMSDLYSGLKLPLRS